MNALLHDSSYILWFCNLLTFLTHTCCDLLQYLSERKVGCSFFSRTQVILALFYWSLSVFQDSHTPDGVTGCSVQVAGSFLWSAAAAPWLHREAVVFTAVSEEWEKKTHNNTHGMSLGNTKKLSKPFSQCCWKANIMSLRSKLKFRLMKYMAF